MKKGKFLYINLLSTFLAFLFNILIAFFLTPFIVSKLGIEAYGFISLGMNFINYITLITLALNSMASRFIAIELHQKNISKANMYYNSVFFSNLFLTLILLIPISLFIVFIERFINIPIELVKDVQILFCILFINFIFSLNFSLYSVATFVKNKIYLTALRNIEANIFKGILLLILFSFFSPEIWYLGMVTFLMTIYIALFNYIYTQKFLPELNINKAFFGMNSVLELIRSGVWNTIIRLGQILLDGMNLLFVNIFMGANAMGILSIVNTIPVVMATLIASIANAFMPEFTRLYANQKKDELLHSLKNSIKILSMLTNIPLAFLIVFGDSFFSLWIPSGNAKELHILSMISLAVLMISGPINTLFNIFTVTNKLKSNAIVLVSTGILNVICVLLLLNFSTFGLYGVLIISSVLGILRNLIFTIPISALYLNLKWNIFYNDVLKSFLGLVLIVFSGYFIKSLYNVLSWYDLIIACISIITLGLIINSVILFSKKEILTFKEKIYTFISEKRKYKI